MAKLKVTQTRSPIGGTENQRATLRSLGLRKIGQTVEIEDRPELRGMVNTVIHLVAVEEVER
jgi:large subunit ribosomal protein L30